MNVAVGFAEDKKLGDQIKAADKLHIPYVVVVGEKELQSGQFPVRDMAAHEEKLLSREELGSFFLSLP